MAGNQPFTWLLRSRHRAAFVLAVIVTGAVFAPSAAPLHAQTIGACNLLTPADIQALTPEIKVQAGKPERSAETDSCHYEWGSGGNVQSGKSFLNVIVSDASKLMPGVDAASFKQGLLAEKGATAIPGIGDAAVLKSDRPISADASAMVKGKILQVTFESSEARAKKDMLVALLKKASSRL